MKRNPRLFKALTLLAIFAVANIAIKRYHSFYEKETEYLESIENGLNKLQIETIFLGDSHIEALGSHPVLGDKSYNLAYGGDGIEEMYIKAVLASDKLPNLKTVVISCEPQIFNSSISPNKAFLNERVLETNSQHVYQKSSISYLAGSIPLLNTVFIEFIKTRYIYGFIKNPRGFLKNNSESRETRWSDQDAKHREMTASYRGKQDHKGILKSDHRKKLYGEMVSTLKSRGISVIGLIPPTVYFYISQCSPEDQRTVDHFLESLDVPKLDYSNLFSDPEMFSDPDHLSDKGRISFNEILSETLMINR